jgi:hypothetical protein
MGRLDGQNAHDLHVVLSLRRKAFIRKPVVAVRGRAGALRRPIFFSNHLHSPAPCLASSRPSAGFEATF